MRGALLLLLGGALSGARVLPSSSSALPSAASGKSGSPRDKVLAETDTIIDVTPDDDLATALDRAVEGDVLQLADGNYSLTATLTVNKKVTIRAKNARKAILEGGGKVRVLSISADAVVQDLVITGGYVLAQHDGENAFGAGISIRGGSPSITGNDIHENTCNAQGGMANGAGIYVGYPSTPTISGNDIHENVCTSARGESYGAGICVEGGSPTISDNDIHENTCSPCGDESSGSGICIKYSSVKATTISGGYIHDHKTCGGLAVYSGVGPVLIAENVTFIWNNQPYDCSGPDVDTSPSCGLYPSEVASCAAPPPPLPPPAPGATVTKFLEMYRVQNLSWISELTNSDVGNLEGEACYITNLFVPTDLPRPVVAVYTLETVDPILDDDNSYLNCADVDSYHQPIPPPRTCLDGGNRTRVGSTHCNISDPFATCQCGDSLGIWYSLPAQGECINGGILGQDCYWRVTNISAIATWDCLAAANCTVHNCPYYALQDAMAACANLPESRKLSAPACGPCDAMAPAGYSACNELGRLDFDPYDCITCLEAPHGLQAWYAFQGGVQSVSWACHTTGVPHVPLFKIDINATSGLNATDVCTFHYGDDGPHYTTFKCVNNQCVASPTGVSKPDCEAVCGTH